MTNSVTANTLFIQTDFLVTLVNKLPKQKGPVQSCLLKPSLNVIEN